jgi:hypothetical protein
MGCGGHWVAQTVEALSYIRNNTGLIHYFNKSTFYTWNSYWVNSACTNPSSSSTSLSFRRLHNADLPA